MKKIFKSFLDFEFKNLRAVGLILFFLLIGLYIFSCQSKGDLKNSPDKNKEMVEGNFYYEEFLRKKKQREEWEKKNREIEEANRRKKKEAAAYNLTAHKKESSSDLKNRSIKTSEQTEQTLNSNTKKNTGKKDQTSLDNKTGKKENSDPGDLAFVKDKNQKNLQNEQWEAAAKVKRKIIATDAEFEKFTMESSKPVILQKEASDYKNPVILEQERQQLFLTHQLYIKKGQRLKSFNTINGPGKDYHLLFSPIPGKKQYYFLTDRQDPVVRKSLNIKEETLDNIKDELYPETYDKLKNMLSKPTANLGSGFLEIVVCESEINRYGTREVFVNPRFTNLKELTRGDKLGFSLFYNEKRKVLEIIYSVDGVMYQAESEDGEHFRKVRKMEDINSEFMDRDPSISRDGTVLVFASSRSSGTNIRAMQLYISMRKSINDKFTDPKVVPGAFNSLGDLFPSVYSTTSGFFIFFKTYHSAEMGFNEKLYSIENRNGVFLPMVPFGEGSEIPQKYITTSYFTTKGNVVMGSEPINDYDLFTLDIYKVDKIYVNPFGEIFPYKKPILP